MKFDVIVEKPVEVQSNTIPAIETFYRENYNRMVKKMTFRTGTVWDAEDVVQEAFARALKYSNRAFIDHLGKWFSMVLNNALRDHMNASKGYSVDDGEVEEESVSCTGFSNKIMDEILDLVQTKSEVQIEVLTLHIREEYSPKEISEITDYSYAQCHQIILRFRNELKTLYKE